MYKKKKKKKKRAMSFQYRIFIHAILWKLNVWKFIRSLENANSIFFIKKKKKKIAINSSVKTDTLNFFFTVEKFLWLMLH